MRYDSLILVDSVTAGPDDLAPELAEVQGIKLERHAAAACERMLAAAMSEGVEIKPISGYRTAVYQRELWQKSIAEHIADGLTAAEAEILTARYLARPFHSEHQTGLACDFCTARSDDTEDNFGSTSEGKWLRQNAHRFGFILRYPRMKEHITGIAYEPWHYRYVGKPHSRIISSRGITLEEYLFYHKDRVQP